MKFVSMVNVTRGKEIESSHQGVAVCIDSSGKVLREWGDSNYLIYPRSSLKPLQSLNLYKNGLIDQLKINDCSSEIKDFIKKKKIEIVDR